MQSKFVSNASKDEVHLILIKKSHKAILKIVCVDDVTEHVNLIKEIEKMLRKEDTKWIEFEIRFIPVMPPNSITYINKHNGNLVCHIEDFLKFYFMNVSNFINLNHIHYVNEKNSGGWTLVGGPKKGKKMKYDKILQELEKLEL